MRLVLAATLAALVGGCVSCEPLLEVRHCLPTQCDPSDDAVAVVWTGAEAAEWPEVDALLRATPPGEHEHRTWTAAQEQAFWDAFGVSGDERELIVTTEDGRFRVRVLTCE